MMTSNKILENTLIVKDEEQFNDIHLAEYAVALWPRETLNLSSELASLGKKQFECRLSGTREELLNKLQEEIALKDQAPRLFEDLKFLLAVFQKITGVSNFRLFLATVDHNMCSKFHTDNNVLRLLCTYNGPGTLWIPQRKVNKELDDEKLAQIAISAAAGEVLILKGAKYPGVGQNAVLHRSPGVEETSSRRLLLRIDMN